MGFATEAITMALQNIEIPDISRATEWINENYDRIE